MTLKWRKVRPGLWRSRWAAFGAAVAVSLGGGGLFVANAAEPGPASAYHAVAPTRAIDTRNGTGVRAGVLGAGETVSFSFIGVAGIPAGADSVAINLTVVGGTEASFLTVYPTGEPLPVASSINWSGSGAVANELTLKLGVGGALDIFNSVGSVHVIADVVGYLTAVDQLGSSGAGRPSR